MWIRFVVALLFFFAASLQAQEIHWKSSLPEGLKAARENHSLVFVQVVTEWCGYCQRLQKEDYPRPEIKSLLAQFITVSIDGDRQPQVASDFHARGYPTLLILQPDGSIIARIDGYPGPQRLKDTLSRVLSENKMAHQKTEQPTRPSQSDGKPGLDLTENQPTDARKHPLDEAAQALQKKQFYRALGILNPFIQSLGESNTEFALARFYRGMALIELGEFDRAKPDLTFAARRAPLPEQRNSARLLLQKIQESGIKAAELRE